MSVAEKVAEYSKNYIVVLEYNQDTFYIRPWLTKVSVINDYWIEVENAVSPKAMEIIREMDAEFLDPRNEAGRRHIFNLNNVNHIYMARPGDFLTLEQLRRLKEKHARTPYAEDVARAVWEAER